MSLPRDTSRPLSPMDGFTLFDQDDIGYAIRQQELEQKVKQDLKAKFRGRGIVKVEIEEPYSECNCFTRFKPESFEKLRFVGRVASLLAGKVISVNYEPRFLPDGVEESSLLCVLPEHDSVGDDWQLVVSSDYLPVKPDQGVINDYLVVELSDQTLALAMGKSVFSSSGNIASQLKTSNLSVLDVCQNDQRSTCTYLAAYLSYISSPIGRKSVQNMFFDFGGGCAYVRLFNSIFEQDVFVKVSKSAVTDEKGSNIFSIPDNQSLLMLLAEKACLGHNIFLKTEQMGINASEAEADYKNTFTKLLVDHVDSKGHPRLDCVNLQAAFSLFPAVLSCIEFPNDAVVTIRIDPPKPGEERVWEENKQLIALNIRYGVPVMFGTRKDWRGKKAALKTGTPTGHAMAVIRDVTAVSDTGRGKSKRMEGVLVIDPYGESLNKDLAIIAAAVGDESGEFILDGRAKAIQFVAWDDIPNRFEEAVIAKGGVGQLPS